MAKLVARSSEKLGGRGAATQRLCAAAWPWLALEQDPPKLSALQLFGITAFLRHWLQVVLQVCVDAVWAAGKRLADIIAQMEKVLPQWPLALRLDLPTALRGISKLPEMVSLTPRSAMSRFDSARQLTAKPGYFIGDPGCWRNAQPSWRRSGRSEGR